MTMCRDVFALLALLLMTPLYAEQQAPRGETAGNGDQQQQRNDGLGGHAGGEDAAAVQSVDEVPGRQGHRQLRDELEQADQAEIPGAACDVVHLPGHGDHQHLVGDGPGQAGQPEEHERPVGEQLRNGGILGRSGH